jgi:uncharacterized phage protein gp47/JayE
MTAAIIDQNGITIPTYNEVLLELEGKYRAIYGEDAYLDADAEDGQLLAVLALAISDVNNLAVAIYNSFSPTTAQGTGLSSIVKINGLRRKIASFGSVTLTCTGVAGTIINFGVAQDDIGNRWALPPVVVIPDSGETSVLATALAPGAVRSLANTITNIVTSVPGWQEVTNPATATPGLPVESDANLRRRQTQSTSIAAQNPVAAIQAGILSLEGVLRSKIYVNSSDVSDINGIPGHSISAVVEGGDPAEIARTICYTKAPGTGTYGDISLVVTDPNGIPDTVNFYALDDTQIYFRVTLLPLAGYLHTTGLLVLAALAQYFEDLGIGDWIFHNRLYAPANLQGEAAIRAYRTVSGSDLPGMAIQQLMNPMALTYNVTGILISADGLNFGDDDIAIAFNKAAAGNVLNGTLTELGS